MGSQMSLPAGGAGLNESVTRRRPRAYEKRYQSARIHRLQTAAYQLGYKLEPQTAA